MWMGSNLIDDNNFFELEIFELKLIELFDNPKSDSKIVFDQSNLMSK